MPPVVASLEFEESRDQESCDHGIGMVGTFVAELAPPHGDCGRHMTESRIINMFKYGDMWHGITHSLRQACSFLWHFEGNKRYHI